MSRFGFVFLISLLMACTEQAMDVSGQKVTFRVFFQGQPVSCQDLKRRGIDLLDFRMYVNQLRYFSSQAAIAQPADSSIQYLDFIQSKCDSNVLEQSLSIALLKDVASKDVSFQIGVPNAFNHQNPVKAAPPLNMSSMHWQWLSGYKFLRLEYELDEQLNRFHLGSWGCSGKIPDAVSCKQPNLINIVLQDFDLQESVVAVHLDELVEVQSASLCMGNPDEQPCKKWIASLQHDVFMVGLLSQ